MCHGACSRTEELATLRHGLLSRDLDDSDQLISSFEIDSTSLIAVNSRAAAAGSRALYLVWLPNRLVYSAGLSPTCFAPLSRSRIVSVWKDVFICFFSVTPQRKPVQDSAARRGCWGRERFLFENWSDK